MLAKDVVRYVGEPVAVVFAEDAIIAEDAADLVALSTSSPLPAIVSATERPGIFERELTTEPDIVQKAYGDADAAFHKRPCRCGA